MDATKAPLDPHVGHLSLAVVRGEVIFPQFPSEVAGNGLTSLKLMRRAFQIPKLPSLALQACESNSG